MYRNGFLIDATELGGDESHPSCGWHKDLSGAKSQPCAEAGQAREGELPRRSFVICSQAFLRVPAGPRTSPHRIPREAHWGPTRRATLRRDPCVQPIPKTGPRHRSVPFPARFQPHNSPSLLLHQAPSPAAGNLLRPLSSTNPNRCTRVSASLDKKKAAFPPEQSRAWGHERPPFFRPTAPAVRSLREPPKESVEPVQSTHF